MDKRSEPHFLNPAVQLRATVMQRSACCPNAFCLISELRTYFYFFLLPFSVDWVRVTHLANELA